MKDINAQEYYKNGEKPPTDGQDKNIVSFPVITDTEFKFCIKYNQKEVGQWIPIIFIREFWDFYSVYTAGNRKETKKEIKEETNNEQNTSTKICNILDNATELSHIRSSLENLNLHYNEICEILEAIVKKLY